LSRDLIKCEKFKELFPEIVVKKDKDTKSNFKIIKKHIPRPGQIPALLQGGNRFSTSVGSTFTGFHGHIQIVDDPQDPAQSLSGVKRKTVNDWLDQTLSRRKVNQKVTPLILIMQRLHQDDATGYLLRRRKNIKHICLPATLDEGYDKLVSPAEWKRYYEDGLLDPERLSKQVLETSKVELGQYGFSGQMGQNPVSPAGGMFKTDNIGILSSTGTVGEITQMIRYWDKAGTQDGGAYTAGVKIAKTSKGKYVVMNVKKGQWASEQRERIIRTTAQADGVDCDVWIEQEPGSGGKESAESTIRNLDGFACRADRATGDKVYRADPFSVQVNNGNVFILQGDWNNDYLEELKLFPMSTFKDQVDASAGAYTKLNATKEARTW
jgi:predicted phage terminase large subunit-like protein